MKSLIAGLCMLLVCSAAFAADRNPVAKPTGKGMFTVEIVPAGTGLKNGANTLEFIVRDKSGKGVDGAELTVTPWLPAMGQGVWDKPVVTKGGGGKYTVRNIVTTISGRWELKIDVSKGAIKDQAVFAFDVSGTGASTSQEADLPRGKYSRTVQRYSVPSVTLLNQDGKKVNLKEMVDSGKPVIFDFIYTTCTTICPVLSASFTNLRKQLGEDADKVQLISLSIDPEHDRPEQMKKYLSRYKAGKGWDFLTGSRENIDLVLKSLDATIIDKMSHEPLYILHAPHSDEWVRIKGLLNKNDLLRELRRIERK